VKASSSGFGIRFSCFLHNLNLTLQPLVKQQKKTKEIAPFFEVTKMLSGRQYETLSLSFVNFKIV